MRNCKFREISMLKRVLRKNIKQRLKQEFGDSLMFYHKSRWETEFVYTDGEADDSSDGRKDELFEDDEIDND